MMSEQMVEQAMMMMMMRIIMLIKYHNLNASAFMNE